MSDSPELYYASSIDSVVDDETIFDIIVAMRIQEEHGGYQKYNYLKAVSINTSSLGTNLHQLSDIERRKPTRRQKSFCSTLFTPNHDSEESYSNTHDDEFEVNANEELDAVDSSCHQKMVQWCYQVCSCCNFRKETVEIAMSILGRFMMTQSGQQAAFDRSFYQLAAMTCFYTAVKVHEPVAMDPSLVSKLSGGVHSVEEVETMESIVLNEIRWKINPPTSLEFCRYMLQLLPSDFTKLRNKLYDVCETQIEFAISEYKAVAIKSSTLACCSILNAMAHIRRTSDNYINPTSLSQYISMMKQVVAGKNTPDFEIIPQVQQFLSISIPKFKSLPLPPGVNKPKKWSRPAQRQCSISSNLSPYPTSISCSNNIDEMNKITEYSSYRTTNENVSVGTLSSSSSKAVNALNGYCATLNSNEQNIHTRTTTAKTKSSTPSSMIHNKKYRHQSQSRSGIYSYHPL
jgi:Cyclin, N-terminal domain